MRAGYNVVRRRRQKNGMAKTKNNVSRLYKKLGQQIVRIVKETFPTSKKNNMKKNRIN